MLKVIYKCLEICCIYNLNTVITYEYHYGNYIMVKKRFDDDFMVILVQNLLGIWSLNNFISENIINEKVKASVKSLIFYTLNVKLLHNYVPKTDWFLNEKLIKGYENHEMSCRDKYLYILSLSYYLIELFEHRNRKVKRKDDNQMLLHHVVTILLILMSYQSNLFRIGLNVIYIFDMNDIMLSISKLLTYNNVNEWITNSTFAIFGVSWVYNRLYLFLMYVLVYLYKNMHSVPEYVGFILLCVIYGLNVFWTKLIASAAYKMGQGNDLNEVNEDYEDN